MSGQTIILASRHQRAVAKSMIDTAPDRAIVNIRLQTRSNEQNAKMWAMLTDISNARPEGRVMDPETWKAVFMHALGWDMQFVEGLDGRGLLPIGYRSSRLSKSQMSDLIEIIYEYGTRHGVKWGGI